MTNVTPLHAHQERQLPASEAAEQALLGAILIRNEVIDLVAESLRPEHFHVAGHGRIFNITGTNITQYYGDTISISQPCGP